MNHVYNIGLNVMIHVCNIGSNVMSHVGNIATTESRDIVLYGLKTIVER